jgi:hypothetical protein
LCDQNAMVTVAVIEAQEPYTNLLKMVLLTPSLHV